MRGLKNKRILVAGANSGIGRETCIRLAEEGAHVMIAGISADKLPETEAIVRTVARLAGHESTIATCAFDIAERASVGALVYACGQMLGGLDGVTIPAAEVGLHTMRSDLAVPHADPELWDRIMHVNVVGQLNLIQAAIPLLKEAGGGAIVPISSASAYMGRATLPAYAASKAALHGLIRHVARVSGIDRIRCNGVAPGLVMDPERELPDPAIKKEMLESQSLKRIGRYSDVAAMISFLLSQDAEWITGQVITVNGGFSMRD